MKKILLIIMLSSFSTACFSQIGINTQTPKSTLDVVGKPTVTTEPDGIKVTNITGNELKAKDASYGVDQNGVMVYITAIPSPTTLKTVNINEVGFYYFDSVLWQKLAGKNTAIIGDVKNGFQSANHGGWVLLNGQAISSLTSTQQINAGTLGLSGNLPNATNAYLSKNGSALGTVSGSNTVSLARNNLPNATLTGTTNTTGAHTHQYTDRGFGSFNSNTTNGSNPIEDDGNITRTTASSGDHSHTVTTESLNGNVTQVAIDKKPLTMSVNVFVYLGE